MRPCIGITTSTLDRTPEGKLVRSTAINQSYARAVYDAGGIPLLLPTLDETADLEDLLTRLDGVLFSGGDDVDPAYWHEPPHPAIGPVDGQRDQFEIELVRAGLRRDIPMLGICRGIQVMTVATGGDLWQDIPSQHSTSFSHKQTAARNHPWHEVRVDADSRLACILWPDGTDSYTLAVNSFHHQAPRACGTLLTAVASGADGIIEALESTHARFVLGVQWHPEDMTGVGEYHARIFRAFIHAAEQYADAT